MLIVCFVRPFPKEGWVNVCYVFQKKKKGRGEQVIEFYFI